MGNEWKKDERKKKKNIKTFNDTKKLYGNLLFLRKSIMDSMAGQKLFKEGESYGFSKTHDTAQDAEVIVSGKRSLEAAMTYALQGKKVCVLNFASATNPGGGVVDGSSAQEESICRCSTLYANLNDPMLMDRFYKPHKEAGNPLFNDDCIYTPGVTVFKTDASVPELMPEEDWYKVNIITCAAPNLRKEPSRYEKFHFCRGAADVTAEQLAILHKSRIRRIFEIAAYGRNEVLILGAFGCGAFRNPPEIVAGVFREVQEEYKNAFETIEYAIYHTDKDVFNYKIFQKKLLH